MILKVECQDARRPPCLLRHRIDSSYLYSHHQPFTVVSSLYALSSSPISQKSHMQTRRNAIFFLFHSASDSTAIQHFSYSPLILAYRAHLLIYRQRPKPIISLYIPFLCTHIFRLCPPMHHSSRSCISIHDGHLKPLHAQIPSSHRMSGSFFKLTFMTRA